MELRRYDQIDLQYRRVDLRINLLSPSYIEEDEVGHAQKLAV